jgi:hypothetical protein
VPASLSHSRHNPWGSSDNGGPFPLGRAVGVRGLAFGRVARSLSRDAWPAIVAFAALVGLAFANGGYFSRTWTVAAVGLLWVAALTLLLASRIELSSLECTWIALVAALVVWTTLSAAWSVDHSESLLDARRDLVYLAGIATVLLLATRASAGGLVAAVWAGVVIVVVYALVRYLFEPGLRSEDFQGYLVSRPVGYSNALGILSGFGVILSLAFAARASTRTFRTLAAAAIIPLAAAVYLTASRGAALAVGLGITAMFFLDPERRQLFAAPLVVAPAAAAVVALAAHSELTDAMTPDSEAAHQGRLVFLWIALGTLAIAAVFPVLERRARSIGPLAQRVRLPAAVAVAAAVGTVLYASGPQVFNSDYRTAYWHVAWTEYRAHPWLGSGAGTFGHYWARLGNQAIGGGVLDAHNLYLETLAELGPVGLALLVALLALPIGAALRVRSDRFAPGATGAYVAFLAHAALDWDWELPAVTFGGLVCAAAVVVAGREQSWLTRRLSGRARGAALVLACCLAAVALVAQFEPSVGGGAGP